MPVLGGTGAAGSSLVVPGKPLARIEEARRRPFRVLLLGTSIQEPNHSLTKLICGGLQKAWGGSGLERRSRTRAGGLGGTLDPPYQGWLKQPYSGVYYLRAKGVPASSAISFIGYGDEIMIEWSRESDAAAATITVDGSSVGTAGASGAQKFGMQTVFTVSKGPHIVTINPPASGAFYFEALEIRDSSRVGVEYIDGTLGGSSLSRCWLVQSKNGQQADPIATEYGAGIHALFDRSDVDLIIMGHTVNDAGSGQDGDGPLNSARPYRNYLRYGLSLAEARGVPVIQIVEPAGHYSVPTGANYQRYINVKQHQIDADAEFPNSTLIDQDTYTRAALGLSGQALADRWYQGVSATPTVVNGDGSFTGDFIHPPAALTNGLPHIHAYTLPEATRVLGLEPGTLGDGSLNMIELPRTTYSNGVRCLRPLAPGNGDGFPAQTSGWIRDAAMSPVSSFTSNIAGAGTSDANGKYFEPAVNQAYGLGATTNTIRMLVLRIGPKSGGSWSIGGNTNILFHSPDGTAWPVAAHTVAMANLPPGAIYTVALLVSQTVANQNLVIAGRIYEAALVAVTTVPVFPAQP